MSEKRTRRTKHKFQVCDVCNRTFETQGLAAHRIICQQQAGDGTTRGLLTDPTDGDYYSDFNYVYDPLGVGPAASAQPTESTSMYDPLGVYSTLSTSGPSRVPPPTEANDNSFPDYDPPLHQEYSHTTGSADEEVVSPEEEAVLAQEQLGRRPRKDDIKIEPHPLNAARKRTRYCPYEKYTTEAPAPVHGPALAPPSTLTSESGNLWDSVEDLPWTPFASRVDFEFARLVRSSNLNEKQTDDWIEMGRKIQSQAGKFTLVDNTHLKALWASARRRYGHSLQLTNITAKYKNEEIVFPLWRIPAWDWCKSLLDDPVLRKEFRWDAERLFRHNGQEFERFFNEPWTANRWHTVQSQLPQRDGEPAVPFCIIFYADKTKLSTMGTKKGYPVYLRCANLPSHIRNSEGLGGGQMVGLLPIVPEDNDKSGKKEFVDFKRVVWHACIVEIIESLRQWCECGYPYLCSDGIKRWLYPIILIISADFEEQCVIAAIRGTGSAFPCPICKAPGAEFPALDCEVQLRTTEEMRRIYETAENAPTAAERDEDLKAVGLRRVNNAFWALPFTDVYLAISWDRLHAYHSGLFRKHILKEFLLLLEDPVTGTGQLRRALGTEFEKNIRNMPRWRDFAHFTNISDFNEYCDGRKYEDLSKIIIFASHSIFPASNRRGYQWLALARSYLELDMWSSLRNHTTTTIAMGRKELLRFDAERQRYSAVYPAKKWDFPKAHSHVHLFDDIEEKGVTTNYNTKYNEKKHKELKKGYQLTNFKAVEEQIARLSHTDIAIQLIERRIEEYDIALDMEKKANIANETLPDDLASADVSSDPDLSDIPWVSCGSKTRIPLSDASANIPTEYLKAFDDLPRKLAKKMRTDLRIRDRTWSLAEDVVVTKHQFVKVNYTSVEDSQIATDFIRINNSFHGRPRYDCALFNAGGGRFTIGRILSVLSIPDNMNVERDYALVIPFDLPTLQTARHRANLERAAHLRYKLLRSRKAEHAIVVALEHIVRGAMMVPDWGNPDGDQFVVMDVIDADFFLRMRLENLGDLLVSDGSLK